MASNGGTNRKWPSFEVMYSELQIYKQKYGHCFVHRGFTGEGISEFSDAATYLGEWWNYQRQSNTPSFNTEQYQERKALLEAIGFPFGVSSEEVISRNAFERNFQVLQRYYNNNNKSLNGILSHHPNLKRWIQKMKRNEYNVKKDPLPPDLVQRLLNHGLKFKDSTMNVQQQDPTYIIRLLDIPQPLPEVVYEINIPNEIRLQLHYHMKTTTSMYQHLMSPQKHSRLPFTANYCTGAIDNEQQWWIDTKADYDWNGQRILLPANIETQCVFIDKMINEMGLGQVCDAVCDIIKKPTLKIYHFSIFTINDLVGDGNDNDYRHCRKHIDIGHELKDLYTVLIPIEVPESVKPPLTFYEDTKKDEPNLGYFYKLDKALAFNAAIHSTMANTGVKEPYDINDDNNGPVVLGKSRTIAVFIMGDITNLDGTVPNINTDKVFKEWETTLKEISNNGRIAPKDLVVNNMANVYHRNQNTPRYVIPDNNNNDSGEGRRRKRQSPVELYVPN